MKSVKETVTPAKLTDDLWAARQSLALVAAIELDIFSVIAQGNRTSAEIARAIKAPRRGLERLLDVLVGMGYLVKRGTSFRLAPHASAFLVRGQDSYLGGFAGEARMALPGWMELASVIRSGQPFRRIDSDEGRDFFPKLVRDIFPLNYRSARILVRHLPKATLKRIEHVLDVAAGSGAWSLPFAQACPNSRITILDYPEVTPVAREYAEKFGVAERYDYQEGDVRQLDFGQKQYDAVILGHIIHSEGEQWGRNLIRKSYRALKPGGTLVIAEMIPNDHRTGPIMPLLFALGMVLNTQEGDVFTLAQYRQWLKRAGFTRVRTVDAQNPSPVIIATR